jgi:ribonuclease HI
METIITYTGAEARGNPGPAAVGICISSATGEVVQELKQTIGNANDNFAAYYAVMLALQTLKQTYGPKTEAMQFEIRLTSEFVKKQLNGEAQIKEPGLVPMYIEIHNLRVVSFPQLMFTQITQELNQVADRLVNEALDAK